MSSRTDVRDVDALDWVSNARFRAILERRRAEEIKGQTSPDTHSGVSVQEGLGLSTLVRSRPISRVLEIGLANGFSSMFILDALDEKPDGLLVSLDPFQDTQWEGRGRAHVRSCGFRTAHEVLTLASWDAYALLKARDVRFDLVFIDGSHAFDNCFADFFLSQKLLAPSGYIAFDDVGWPGVERVCEYVLANRECEVELVEGARGGAQPPWKTLLKRVGARLARTHRTPSPQTLTRTRVAREAEFIVIRFPDPESAEAPFRQF